METKKSKKANLESKKGIFLQLGFVIAISLVLISFEWAISPAEIILPIDNPGSEYVEEIVQVTHREKHVPPPPPPPPATRINIVEKIFNPGEELVIENMEVGLNMDMPMKIKKDEEPPVKNTTPFVSVQDMPSFQGGGLMTFRKYVQGQLKYPREPAENGVSGTVILQFVIDSHGKVVQAKVIRGVHPQLDKEALRAINSSPRWKPGKQGGMPVPVIFTLPVVFVLQ
jgi:protein TonB